MTPTPVTVPVVRGADGRTVDPNDPAQLRALAEAAIQRRVQEQLRAGTPAESVQADERRTVAALEARIAQLEQIQRVGFVPGSAESSPESRDGFSLLRVMRSLAAGGDRRLAPAEWEMHDLAVEERRAAVAAGLIRAQSTLDDSLGGFLIPGQVEQSLFVPLLHPKVTLFQLGANDFPATGIPVEIPKEVQDTTATATPEHGKAAESDPVKWGKLSIYPHTATSFLKAPNRFLELGQGAEQYLRNHMAGVIARTIDNWGFYGSGGENEPPGLLSVFSIASTSFSGVGATDYAVLEKLWLMRYALVSRNVLSDAEKIGWAFSEDVVLALHMLKSEDTTAAHGEVNRKVFTTGEETKVLGYDFASSTIHPAGTAVLGDYPKLVVPRWGGIVLEASRFNEDAMRRRQTHFLAYQDVGVGCLREASFQQAASYDTSSLTG